MSPHTSPKGIIFDLGDVLFNWSPETKTTIPARTMQSMVSSAIWEEYESGRIEQDACYDQVAQHFSLPTSEVAEAFSQARNSLQPNNAMVSFIHELKGASRGALDVYAMSNISKEDYAILSTKMADWSVFNRVFTSGHAGMRKPDLSFYHYVLAETKLAPEEAVFIDDKMENVLAARSMGINGILFDDNSTVTRTLHNVIDGPVRRGYEYLYSNAKHFDSITDSGVIVPDNFAQLLILEATQDRKLVNIEHESRRTWNFFSGEQNLIPGHFPDDLDTTALALMVLQPRPDVVTSALDEMLEYVNSDGTVLAYYDRNRPRTDPVVSANVLACFYSFGRGQQLTHVLPWIHSALLHRTYLQGTRYYATPDCCIFFFGRLLQSSNDVHLHTTLGSLVKERTQERVGQSGSALDLALRILTCGWLGVNCDVDRRSLMDMQGEDGSWEVGWMYKTGRSGVNIGNKGFTTAMAVKAIASLEKF